MPELEDLIMSQQVSDSPEETPEDRMRAALMQRLGVAPEVRAKQMSDQVLGQGGQGFSGLMNRIFGGAHEGLRVANDPKYRGAYQEALASAMEQEKNLMPYARQLEMSGAMRDKAKMDAREKERATLARVLDSTLKNARAKAKNGLEQQAIDQKGRESAAKIELLLSQGKVAEARAESLKVKTEIDEMTKRFGGKVTNEMANSVFLGGPEASLSNMTGPQAKQGVVDMSLGKAAGPGMLAMQKALGLGNRGTSRESTSWRPTGEDAAGRKIFEQFTSTSRSGGGQQPNIGAMMDIQNRIQGGAAQGPPLGQPTGAPVNTQTATPETRGAAVLGVQPKPVKVPPAVGSTPLASTVRKGVGYSSGASAKAAGLRNEIQSLATDTRKVLTDNGPELFGNLGIISGGKTIMDIQRAMQDPKIQLSPQFKEAFTSFQRLSTRLALIERKEMSGVATNESERADIKKYMPDTSDTLDVAMTKSISLDAWRRFHNKVLEQGIGESPYQAGRLEKFSVGIKDLYKKAYAEKDPAKRKALMDKAEAAFDSDFIYRFMTGKK